MERRFLRHMMIALLAAALAGGAELIFRAPYDDGFAAVTAGGEKEGKHAQDVLFETLPLLLGEGVDGRAMRAGIEPGDPPGSLCCVYPAAGNLRLDAGTVSLWVRPLDWQGDDWRYHILFQARSRESALIVYKYLKTDQLFFLYGPTGKDAAGAWRWSTAKASVRDWGPDRWRHVAATWGDGQLHLYLDGRLRGVETVREMPSAPFDVFGVGGTDPGEWQDPAGEMLIDEVRIYDGPLPAASVAELWREHAPPEVTPRLALPAASPAVTVDGRIGDDEYPVGATGFFDLTGYLAAHQSRYWLAGDGSFVYVAVQSPVVGSFTDKHAGRDGPLHADDAVEVFLQPGGEGQPYFQFVFNGSDTWFDGRGQDANWNAEGVRIAQQRTADTWTLEVAIPVRAVAAQAPAPGDTWRFNICRSFPGISAYTSVAPVRKGYHDAVHFGILQFRDAVPAYALESLGALRAGTLDLCLAVRGGPVAVRALLQCRGQTVVDARETASPASGETATVTVAKSGFDPVGNLLLTATGDDGDIVCQFVVPFSSGDPLTWRYLHTDLERQQMLAAIQIEDVLTAGKPMQLSLRLLDGEDHMVREVKLVPDRLLFEVPLDVAGVAPGDYTAALVLSAADGREIAARRQAYRVPVRPAPWVGNQIGITDQVPPPWSPLTVSGEMAIDCWGRRYDFTGSLLPAGIRSGGQDLLAAPAAIHVGLNGTDTPVTAAAMAVTGQTESRVELAGRGTAGSVVVTTTAAVEYDGFAWFELTVTPAAPTAVDYLRVDIPLRPAAATLVNPLKKDYAALGPGGQGAIPPEGFAKNVYEHPPILWVGNEDVGLEWFAETLAGWATAGKDKAVCLLPGATATVLRLNVIDHRVELTEPRTIRFGLQATPVRPPPPDWRRLRPRDNLMTWFPWGALHNYPDAAYAKPGIAEQLAWRRARGQRVFHYFAGFSFSPFAPEWPYWCDRWRKQPPALGSIGDADDPEWALTWVCPNSANYREFYLWKMAGAIDDLDIDNLYFDNQDAQMCGNPTHGCGWIDDQGRRRDTYNILGTRELAKRIYVLLKQRHPDALICRHMSAKVTMPQLAFADICVDGELYVRQLATEESYYKVFKPAMFRAAYLSRQWGPVMFYIPQFARSAGLYNRDRLPFWSTPEARPAVDHFRGYMLVHDAHCVPVFGVKLDDIRQVQDEFGWDEQVEFLPYWRPDLPFTVTPVDPRIMVSAYRRAGRLMLVALNDTDAARDVRVVLDMAHLLPDRDPPLTALREPLRDGDVTVRNGAVVLSLPPRGFALLVSD